MRRFCGMVSLALMLSPAMAAAQERGPLVLRLPASTRTLALGNAFPVGSTDSDAIFYHAAFPTRLRGAGLAAQWWGGRATQFGASAAIDWWSGALALGVRALEYGSAELRPGEPPVLPLNEAAPGAEGSALTAERAASLAYARRIKGVNTALTAHLVEQRVSAERNAFAALDAGVGAELGRVATALSVRNIGPGYERGGVDVDLPLLAELTAATIGGAPVGPLDVLPVVSLRYEMDGDVIPAAGLELSYWPVPGRTFSLRLGARRADDGVRPFTAGAGFTGDRLILDYALVPLDGGRVIHRAGVRWR